jgi:type IV pilus assembly protein PilN
MIEINLLPHREARRAADLRQTVGLLALGLVLAGSVIYVVHNGLESDLNTARASVRQLESDIARFEPQQKQVAAFKEKRRQLEEKLDVIGGLDKARTGPVRVLDELSVHTPAKLWVTVLQTKGVSITIEGLSLDTGVVADFLRSLNSSQYFENVDLDQTNTGPEEQGVKLVKFVITADMAAVNESS